MSQKIMESLDYSKFELLPFNRDVERTKYLEESMKTHGWIDAYPMHVVRNGRGQLRIKAGHHRFEVARKLHIPVKYVVCNDKASIHQLERATNRWTIQHFLVSYVRDGFQPYIFVKKYHERTGIPLLSCISMLSGESAGSHNKLEEFKMGKYQLGDVSHAEMIADIVSHCKNVGIEWATNSLFVSALSRIAWANGFNPNLLKRKIKTHSYLIQKQPSVRGYIEMLDAVYNRQSQDKVPLAFLSDQAAKERSAAG